MNRIKNAYWLAPQRLLAGPYPAHPLREEQTSQQLEWLLQQGIRYWIDLTQVGEGVNYRSTLARLAQRYNANISWQRFPIADFGLPTRGQMALILDEIDRSLDAGNTVYFHCMGGLGRTGTVAACWLIRHGLPAEQALQQLQTLRQETANHHSASPETDAQREFVMTWGSKQSPDQNHR